MDKYRTISAVCQGAGLLSGYLSICNRSTYPRSFSDAEILGNRHGADESGFHHGVSVLLMDTQASLPTIR